MMWGRDEECRPNVVAIEKLLWLPQVAGLWTNIIDSKKQALRGLKKAVDDTQ
jgi:hypothetical protein